MLVSYCPCNSSSDFLSRIFISGFRPRILACRMRHLSLWCAVYLCYVLLRIWNTRTYMSVCKYMRIPCSCWFLGSSHGILQAFALDPWFMAHEYLLSLQQKRVYFADVSAFKLAVSPFHMATVFIFESTLYTFSQISIFSCPLICISSSQVHFLQTASMCNPVQACVFEAATQLALHGTCHAGLPLRSFCVTFSAVSFYSSLMFAGF